MALRSSNLIQKVFIVEDHPMTRDGLRLAIPASAYEVVGECADVEQAIHQISRLNPDIVLFDHTLKDKTGLDLLASTSARRPGLKYVLITQTENPIILQQYLKLGVTTMISKLNTQHELTKALDAVQTDTSFICDTLRQILDKSAQAATLTMRELEVLRYIAQGKTNKEIAKELDCSEHTIKSHKTNVMRKLEIPTSVGISVWAIKNNIA